ncbi:MAG: LysE family translocator [Burkholderiaceae bacterium]|jgi:threonine/homoserine/homoserine lactone efflux protein|nr:LysE family translocator [Burkholderiaceae bacterium]
MLGISDYPAFVGAVIVFLAIPGPGNLALLTATAQGGRKGGISATCGVIVGDQVLMWAAVGGLAAVLQAAPIWFLALQWAGALYLGYLGVQMIRAKPEEALLLDMSSGRYFRQTLFITLLNPKAIVFYMAFFPLFIDPAQNPGWLTFASMSLTVAVLTFLYGAGLTLLAHRLAGNMQTHPLIGQWLQKIAGAVLLGFGLRLVLQK